MFAAAFWRATIQRVVRSFAASLVALLVADGTGVLNAKWVDDLSTALMAGVVTLLLCLAGGATSGAGPAFGTAEVTSPPAPPLGAKNELGQVNSPVAVGAVLIVLGLLLWLLAVGVLSTIGLVVVGAGVIILLVGIF